ncbi:hypothetical protein QK292_17485 [Arthrobacter sp. AL08]|uniref:hypothetical protein n=1 Tax=unclassified Arthrobacter TaxID=235627 RepID=UPI00249AFDF7|nr:MULTISPECIES: hypothetical protein [unclassified Arthrobacter]MDI3243347.1 hypothetical protein [Arthrobacter sp. AL05]MDI3279347.1 hypothetical protein [Arthrobacter sp. AL08]
MADTARLRERILSLEGVQTLYPVDPAWKSTARLIRAALDPDAGDPDPEYVRFSTEGTSTTVSVRVGADGTVPAADLARTIAATLRTSLDEDLSGHDVKVTVEVSSIRHRPEPLRTGPTP